MARFTLTIDTGNAAFDEDAGGEVARILTGVAHMVDGHGLRIGDGNHWVADANGNRVGAWVCVDDTASRWKLSGGRWLVLDGERVFALQRGAGIGPSTCDTMAHHVCNALNAAGVDLDTARIDAPWVTD